MQLTSPYRLRGLTLRNRMVKSATQESMAGPDGEVTPELVAWYRRLAAGGVGLIISGNVFHSWAGHNWPRQLGLQADGMIDGYRRLTGAVHDEGGAIFAQVNDCGREAISAYTRGHASRGPSAVPELVFLHIPHAMTRAEIHETIVSFARACGRARSAGFDGVQLHGAHGYLINQFLSPFTNRRRDEYGGSLPNRWRFVQELYRAVRAEVGDDYPVIIKMNADDKFPLPMGVRFKEAKDTARMLAAIGIDAIELSCGLYESGMTLIRGPVPVRLALRTTRELAQLPAPLKWAIGATQPVADRLYPFRENYNLAYAAEVKRLIPNTPLMTVGGVRDPRKMEDIIATGSADFVSMARPLICEPNFPKRIHAGDLSPSKCVNCNICLMHIEVEGLRCYHGKEPAEKRYW
jgi:2,4-dienoyl-CoA reductase-like NADH-dependent reductase (Old Yellow Enzyme family)